MPLQPGMQNLHMPFSAFIEYGRTEFPVSLIAGASVRTTFNIDRFMLNPNNLMIALQYAPLTGTVLGKKFNIYASGGFNACYSRFTENLYPGIVNYEYKVEKKIGAGISAGLGAGYRYKSWELKPLLLFFTGNAGFFAGHFTEQKFNTGSLQLHITISHRLVFNKNSTSCPVYNKYYRL